MLFTPDSRCYCEEFETYLCSGWFQSTSLGLEHVWVDYLKGSV